MSEEQLKLDDTKLVPGKPSSDEIPPGYKKTEVGVIPEDWEVKKLDFIAQVRKHRVLPAKASSETLCVELEHIGQGDGMLHDSSTAEESSSSKYPFFANDVLFGRLRPYLKKFWFATQDGICSTEIWPLTVEKGTFSSRFLYYIVQTDSFAEASEVSYGTHMPRADWKVLRELPVAVPPFLEQRAIAEVLSDTESLIESLDKLIHKKRAMKKAAMQQLLTGKTRLPGFGGQWERKTLGDIVKLIPSGIYGSEKREAELVEMPVATTSHIDENDSWNVKTMETRFFAENQVSKYAPREGDLIVVKSSGSAASIQSGKVGSVDADRSGTFIFSNFLMLLRPLKCNTQFLFFQLISDRVKRMLPELVEASTYPNIRINDYLNIEVPLPSEEEQQAIVTILCDMDRRIRVLERRRDKIKQIKQGMMQQLLTGRIRLLKKEVAS